MSKERIKALAEFLEIKEDEIEVTRHNENTFDAEGSEYMVLTDDEADQRAADGIRDSVWAFNTSFLVGHMPDGVDEEILKIAQEKCEGANETLKAMIVDLDHFVDDAIASDGRAHFLNTYDGEEHEQGDYFIYRTN